MTRRTVHLSVLALVAAAGLAHAQGWAPYMEETPLGRFNDKDLSLFEAARIEALELRPDGAAVHWSNPQTGASGSVTPLETNDGGDRECRLLRIINRAGEQTGNSRFWFCKMPDGTWKSMPAPKGKGP